MARIEGGIKMKMMIKSKSKPFAAPTRRDPPARRAPKLPPAARARQRVLTQWRGLDLTAEKAAQSPRVKTAGDVMPRVMAELRMDRRQSEAEVVKVWNQLMDPNIIAHAQPASLWKGTLFVTVDSSVWLSEIVRYRRKEILERLQHGFGSEVIKKISFRVG